MDIEFNPHSLKKDILTYNMYVYIYIYTIYDTWCHVDGENKSALCTHGLDLLSLKESSDLFGENLISVAPLLTALAVLGLFHQEAALKAHQAAFLEVLISVEGVQGLHAQHFNIMGENCFHVFFTKAAHPWFWSLSSLYWERGNRAQSVLFVSWGNQEGFIN